MSNKAPVAVMDAAIAYGASRWMRGVHQAAAYDKIHDFKKQDDKWLFVEFLHNLLLYDRIDMDITSSRWFYAQEIRGLFGQVNDRAKTKLLNAIPLSPYDGDDDLEVESIAEGVCDLINTVTSTPEGLNRVLSVEVPFVYRSTSHHDYEMITKIAGKVNLPSDLTAFALFSYRGLCYSGFANFQSRLRNIPTVYLASPGRISALKEIVDVQTLKRMTAARQAYHRVGEVLKLPENGYSFSHLPTLDPLKFSLLAQAVAGKSAQEALELTLNLRDSQDGSELRKQWAEKIFAASTASALGLAHSGEQKMDNITAGGDVIQIYHATPAE